MRFTGQAVLLLTFMSLAVSSRAQGTRTDVPDRFFIEVGGFNIGADTNLVLSSAQIGGTTVDFETDLNLPDRATTVWVDGFWRVGRRHLVSLSFAHLGREGGGTELKREIHWGGQVYPVGLRLQGSIDSDYVSGAYRFAVYRNDTFEIGPAIGFGYVRLTARLDVQASAGGPGASLTDREGKETSPTGNLGGYLRWWPARRLLLRGDFRYILVKPEDSEASLTDGQAGLTYYPWPKVGFGAHYSYNKFRYDRGLLSSKLGGSYRYSGVQVLASFAF